MRNIALPVSILVGAAMISGAILWSAGSLVRPPPSPTTAEAVSSASSDVAPPVVATVNISDVKLDASPFIGHPKAPVAMAYWFDYQCPYCRQVETTVMPRLIADYVNTGKLRIYFKDFSFLGQDSHVAALAARAVWEVAPKAFYQWHAAMFVHQDAENQGWGSASDIVALTKSLPDIDESAVETTLAAKSVDYQKLLDADLAEAETLGINGTPGAIIGDQLIDGARPYRVFQAAVEQALKANGGGS